MPPDFVEYDCAQGYLDHYKSVYCRSAIMTVDGVRVYFSPDKFHHAFYEKNPNTGRKNNYISKKRAMRIDWIKSAIESASAQRYQGYHRRSGHISERCVSIVYDDYVVVLDFSLKRNGDLKASFVTAYVADTGHTIKKIKSGPVWSKSDCLLILKGEGRGGR